MEGAERDGGKEGGRGRRVRRHPPSTEAEGHLLLELGVRHQGLGLRVAALKQAAYVALLAKQATYAAQR